MQVHIVVVPAGMYSLAEINLQSELGEESLQAFAADLGARASRRATRAAQQQLQDEEDAERADALLKAKAGPSAAELKVKVLGQRIPPPCPSHHNQSRLCKVSGPGKQEPSIQSLDCVSCKWQNFLRGSP